MAAASLPGESEILLEMETLAQRLEYCTGSELLSTLEELEAHAASRPDLGTAVIPALFGLMSDPSSAGAEATQQAVEVVSRLASPKVASEKARRAAEAANGSAVAGSARNVVILLDLLESEVCETYTVVVVLELLATLAASNGEALRAAVLEAPAGAGRLVETLSDGRDEVRNAGVQLWERLTRPEAGSAHGEVSTADELRTVCAFNDGFAKIARAIESDEGAGRDAARLAANVLSGPPVAATLFVQAPGPLRALCGMLALPPAAEYDGAGADDDEFQEPDETTEPRAARPRRRRAALAEALANAAAAITALWRLVARGAGAQAPATVWRDVPARSALLALGLDDDLLEELPWLDDGKEEPADVTLDTFWMALASDEPRRLGALRRATRAAALEVLRLCVADDEAHAIAMCEVTFPSRRGRTNHALRSTLALATSSSPAAAAARALALAAWAPEAAAVVAVMHAVAPPPPMGEDEVSQPALEILVEAIESPSPVLALGLLRRLLARSPSVRELALKISGSSPSDGQGQTKESLLVTVVRRLLATEDIAALTHGLAVVCAWLRDNGAAAHALLRDPEHADGLAKIARSQGPTDRAKGLAALALGLCLENFGDEERAGWTQATVAALVQRRVGLGAFACVFRRHSSFVVARPRTIVTLSFLTAIGHYAVTTRRITVDRGSLDESLSCLHFVSTNLTTCRRAGAVSTPSSTTPPRAPGDGASGWQQTTSWPRTKPSLRS